MRVLILKSIFKYGKNKDVRKKLTQCLAIYTIFSAAYNDKFDLFEFFAIPNIKMNFTCQDSKQDELDARVPILEWLTFISEDASSRDLLPNHS